MAMYQVAQYWNECMQIADEEQDYASFKIDALQDSLHRHQSKLSETRSRLEEKKGELRHMETCYQQLQEESGRTAECNKQLEGEIESLQAHILESKGRVTEFENKTRRYRDKINEAITEQQNLWHRSKGFHATSMAEIEKDHQHRMAESKKIEEALGVSRQKRDEMKRCLGELRNNMDQELQTKDKAISDLQCKLMEQEKRLRSENDLAAAVSRQLEAQKSTEKTIAALESKVDSVLANSRKARGELDNDVSYMGEAYKKIEALVQRLEACEVNSLPAAIKQTARRMEKKVEAHVNGALHAASEAHDAAMATLHGTASGLQMELNNISQEMSRRNKAFEDAQVGSNDAQERLHKRLDASQSDLAAMRQQVEGLVNEWAQQSQANISPSETEIDLKKKFDERGDTICFLEQKLQSLAEATSLKMTALAEKALNNGQNAQTELRNVISAFKRSLEQGFKVAQDGSEKSLRHTQTAMAALGGQLRAVSDQLEARFCASDDGDTSGTSHPAVQELTHRLQERIRDLESQVRATASLRERWQHDIRTVDSLKTQLRSIEDRVPQVQDVGSTVERIAEVNRLLHSTAQYLAGERLWVQKHRDHISAQSKAGMVPQEVEQPNQLAADSGESSLIPHIKTSLVLGDVPCLEVPLVRDVTVENSGTKAVHPLAPSIEQEQVRRREGAKPRPILKVSSSQEADEIDAHRNAEIACRTDGRVSFGDTSSLSMATEKMVRDIRNGLLSSESVDSVSSLPTIATFERENPMLDKRWITKAGSKRHRKEPDEMPELMKRVRIVSDLSFTDIDASHG
ncbi:hypothetical protein PLIIFM63780_005678 [Purpureocillium lilacinum]|nr:hypothetical protein PLIIFM63780_005678 [Purpureocillium lilacinum]